MFFCSSNREIYSLRPLALAPLSSIFLDKISNSSESASGLREYISLLEEQKNIQAGIISDYEKSLKVYQKDLTQFGFDFNSDGTIKNLDNVLDGYQGTGDLEYITELVDEYLNLVNSKLL